MYLIRIDPSKNKIYITLGTIVTGDGEKLGYIVGLAETVREADAILDSSGN